MKHSRALTFENEWHVSHVQSSFVTNIIHESTQVEHATNTITLTFAANVELVPGVRSTLADACNKGS